MEFFQRQHNRATKRKGNKQDQAELAAAATKNALRVGNSKGGSQQRGEAEEANALASQADLDPDHIPFIIIDKTTNVSET